MKNVYLAKSERLSARARCSLSRFSYSTCGIKQSFSFSLSLSLRLSPSLSSCASVRSFAGCLINTLLLLVTVALFAGRATLLVPFFCPAVAEYLCSVRNMSLLSSSSFPVVSGEKDPRFSPLRISFCSRFGSTACDTSACDTSSARR